MMDLILPAFELNLWYSQKLVADVPDEQMLRPARGGARAESRRVLARPHGLVGRRRGRRPARPAAGLPRRLEGPVRHCAQPLPDRSRYPSKAVLLRALEDAHARLADAVTKAPPEVLNQPPPEMFRDRCPTVGALLAVWMTTHEATHNGQLSAWRRAMGLPPAL